MIELAINESVDRVLAKLNEFSETELAEVPNRLTFIIRDVAIKRYNRLNSEGASADSEEGRSFNWDKYLDEYETTLKKKCCSWSKLSSERNYKIYMIYNKNVLF